MTAVGPPPEAAYYPGEWVALATRDTWLLVAIDPSNPAVQIWWDAMRTGTSIDGLLGLLVHEGFRVVQSFALVAYDIATRSGAVALRGAATIRLVGHDHETDLRGEGAATWLQRDLDDSVTTIVLAASDGNGQGVRLPLTSGVSMASTIEVELAGRTVAAQMVSPSPRDGAPAQDLDIDREPDEPDEEVLTGELSSESSPEPPTFDHLFGATQGPPVQPADAVPSAEAADADQAEAESNPVHAGAGIETLRPTDTIYPIPSEDPEPATPGLIDALPWSRDSVAAESVPEARPTRASSPLPASPTPPGPLPTADETVNRAALLASAGVSTPQTGPTVKAVRCPAGHLSPAHANVCRICQTELAPQGAFTAPRPVLGSIRLSTGDIVTLDRGVVLGRAPEGQGGNDPDRPHVVKLASPEKDISRTHLEVRLDGWHVLVTDLDSVNGTVVTPPGQPPQRLRANDPLAIEPGTVVSLADEVTFVYEVGAR